MTYLNLCRTIPLLVRQHTTIKVSKRYWLYGSCSSGFDHFSPAGLFQKLAKPCKGGWPCIDEFGYDFRVPWGVWNNEVFDGDFLPSKNEGKDVYVQQQQQQKCHRSGYFSHIESFSSEQFNVPFWITLTACSPHADHWGSSHHILESRRLVHRRYLYEVLYHFLIPITKEYV